MYLYEVIIINLLYHESSNY